MAQGTRQWGCLGPNVKKCLSIFYTYKFFQETTQKKFTIELQSYIAMLLYFFFDSFFVYLPKKNGNCKMAQGCQLSPIPCRKIRSGRWSAQARNVGSQCWLSILDRWSIEAWMIIPGLYWLVILAPKSLPMIGRESLPELSRRSFKFIKILIIIIKFKT